MSIPRLRDEDREFMLTQILGEREAAPTATELLRMARIEHGSSMHYQSRHDRTFQAQPSSARVQFGSDADQTVAINSDGIAPDEPTELALDVPKHFSIKHSGHKFGSLLAGNAIFAASKDAAATDGGADAQDTPATPSNRWHVAPFPIRIAMDKDLPGSAGSVSGTGVSPGGGARSKGLPATGAGTRSVPQLALVGLAGASRQHGGGSGGGGVPVEEEEGAGEEEEELLGPHSELVDRADEVLNTARSNRNRRGSLDDGTGAEPGSSFKQPEPVYAKSATKFVANLSAGAPEAGGGGGGAVVGKRKHVDANSRNAWAAAAAAAGVQVSGGSFSAASASGAGRAPPVRRASQVSYGDWAGAAAAAAAGGGDGHGGAGQAASDTLPTAAAFGGGGARFLTPAPPPPRAGSHGLGAVSSNSRRSSVVGEASDLPAAFNSCGGSGTVPSASHSRILSRGPSALSMGIPDPSASCGGAGGGAAGGSSGGGLAHGHSWKQQQHRSEATYGGAGLIGGISTEQEAASTLGLLAKVAHTDLRPAAPQLWTADPTQAPGVVALSAATGAAPSAAGGALAPQPQPGCGPSRTASSAALGVGRRLSSSALGLLGSRAHRATQDEEAAPASSAGSATSAAAADVASGAHGRIAPRRSSITDGLGGRGGAAEDEDDDAEFLAAQAAALAEFGGALRARASRNSLFPGGAAGGLPAAAAPGGPLRGGPAAPRMPRGAPLRNASCVGNISTASVGGAAAAAADAPRPAARRRGSIDETLLMQQRGGGGIMAGRRRSMEEAQQLSMSRFMPAAANAAAALAGGSGGSPASQSHGQVSSGLLPALGAHGGAGSCSQQRLPSILSAPVDAVGSGSSSSQVRLQQQQQQPQLQAHHSGHQLLHHYPGHCNLTTPEPSAALPGHYNPYAGKSAVAAAGDDHSMETASAAHARHERFAHLPTPSAVLHDASAAAVMRAGGGAAGGGVLAAPPPVVPPAGGRRLSASFLNAYAGLGGGDDGGPHMARESFNPLADVSPAGLGTVSSSTSGGGGRRSSGEFQRPHAPSPTHSHGSLAAQHSGKYDTYHASDAGGGDAGGGGGEAGVVDGEGVLRKLRGAFSGLLHKGDSKGHGQSRADY